MNGFWQNRPVLITGLTGFIGCWLARRLVEEGARVVGFDLDSTGALDLHPGLAGRIKLFRGDILDQPSLTAALREQATDTCFHLAGQSMIETGLASPVRTFDINIRGTWSVLEACREAGVRRVVVSSSNTIYGNQSHYPFDEDAPLNGAHPYAASKACCDIITRSYAKSADLDAVVCRQTNTFGGADPHRTHIVPATILSLLRGERPVINSDGTPVKAYLYVEDTVSGYMALAEMAHQPTVSGGAFNITAKEPVSVLDLVKAVIRVAGSTDEPEVRGTPATTRREREHLSPEKARMVLGWQAAHTLEAGLAKTWDWYRSNADRYERIAGARAGSEGHAS